MTLFNIHYTTAKQGSHGTDNHTSTCNHDVLQTAFDEGYTVKAKTWRDGEVYTFIVTGSKDDENGEMLVTDRAGNWFHTAHLWIV